MGLRWVAHLFVLALHENLTCGVLRWPRQLLGQLPLHSKVYNLRPCGRPHICLRHPGNRQGVGERFGLLSTVSRRPCKVLTRMRDIRFDP